MKMFGLGVLWAIYALLMVVLSDAFIDNNPDRTFRISSAEFQRPESSVSVRRVRHDREIDSQCASWTMRSAIHDHSNGTATYVTECSSFLRAVLLNIVAGILIFAPIIILFILRRRSKHHA